MSTKKINLKDFANELGKHRDELTGYYKKAVYRGAVNSIPDLVKDSPVDTGLYAQSWELTETEKSVIIGNFAPHAPVIEWGARPFTPPLAPLLRWAKRVLKDDSQPPSYSGRVYALAVATQKKIASQGIEPRHVMENNIDKIIENIKKEFTRL